MVGVHNNHRLNNSSRLVVRHHVDHWLDNRRVLSTFGDVYFRVNTDVSMSHRSGGHFDDWVHNG